MSDSTLSAVEPKTAASRAWYIPHIRLSILQNLASNAAFAAESFQLFAQRERATLIRYLTLDKATCRDIALLLYPDIKLDDFPWDCTCEERTRLYAAGVRVIRTGGCLPLCSRWNSLAEMLEFFPNVHSIFFDSTRESYLRARHRDDPGRSADELRMVEKIRLDGSSFCPPKVRYLPEGLDYECWYHLEEDVAADYWSTASFDRDSRGELILPEVLRLPAYRLSVWTVDGGNPEWFHVLQRRKALGIETHSIHWRIASFEQLDTLAKVAGVGLRGLDISCYAEVFEDTSQTATAIMNRIDAARFPDLRTLTLHIDFPSPAAPPMPPVTPEWLSRDMPPQLSSIQLDLVLDTWLVDETEGFLPMEYVEYVFEERAPRKFIIDVRTKLGEDFSFLVNTEYYDESSIVDYSRSNSSFIDFLLYEPLSVARGDTSSSSSDLSSGDDYESDLEDEPGSEPGEGASSAQPETEVSVGDNEDDESMGGSEESRYDEYGLGYDDEGASAQDDDDESRSGSEELCYDEYGSQEEEQDEDASAEDVFMESDEYLSSD